MIVALKPWVVSFRRDGIFSNVEYTELYANNAQAAVDYVRYNMNVYEVCDCFKKVRNWS